MNIFVVDENPDIAAKSLVDRHVVKMILESSQMLKLAHIIKGSLTGTLAWKNHPCSIWTRDSIGNYLWLAKHNLSLCNEYTYRYNKIHKLQDFSQWLLLNVPNINKLEQTAFVEVTMGIHKQTPILTYRKYYIEHKCHIMTWLKRDPPNWILDAVVLEKNNDRWKYNGVKNETWNNSGINSIRI
jgi:hypothetical protein